MVTLQGIQKARADIRDALVLTPCARSHALSEIAGIAVYLKLENLQRTGAFKERGALTKLLSLSPDERKAGLITASAGNHAQAVAYHASRLGMKAEIWMPLTTPLVKVSATTAWGAEVRLEGTNFDETFAGALDETRRRGATFVHPFDDEQVITGQGTLGLEMLEQVPALDLVLVPVGGGGLIGGVAAALKQSNPKIKVIGVQTSQVPSMAEARIAGRRIETQARPTIADGIAVRLSGAITFPMAQEYVDDIVLVDEEEIAAAVLFLLEKEKTLAEGAGAVGVAAMLHRKLALGGKTAATIVSGGNMDVTLLARIIERGLVKNGRLVRLRIPLPDHPGALHRLTKVIADHRVNIVETSYHRAFHGARLGHTVIDLTMEIRGHNHGEELMQALDANGYEHEQLT